MPEFLPLNVLFNEYHTGIMNKKQLEGKIFQFVLDNHKRFYLFKWNREECIDYLCWLYPRLSKAIDKYQDQGTSFDAYISALIYYSSREYRFRERDHHISEHVCWKEKANDLLICSNEPSYPEKRRLYKPVSNPQQILILLLKSYYFVSDDFILRIAPALGLEKEILKEMIDELRTVRTEKEEKIRSLQERIYSQFYRCIAFEKRKNAAPEGSALQKKLQDRLYRARIRLVSMRKRLSVMRLDATNSQIADILGVPKGTIDSALHFTKLKYTLEESRC
jgi:hypothetical protein